MFKPFVPPEPRELTETESLLVLTQNWYLGEGDTFISEIEDDEPRTIVPASLLAEHHPLLPAALRAHIARNQGYTSAPGRAGGSLVNDTVTLLRTGGVVLHDTHGRECLFVDIDTVDSEGASDDEVHIGGIALRVQYVEHGETQVPYVTQAEWADIHVDKEELDVLYPDWERRLTVGTALGLDDKALGRHVFSKDASPVVSTTLTNVTFDEL